LQYHLFQSMQRMKLALDAAWSDVPVPPARAFRGLYAVRKYYVIGAMSLRP
jgi:hypothetical protein